MIVERHWTPPIEARIAESNRFKDELAKKEYNVPLERLVSELTEAIILGAIERPAKYGGAGVTLYIRCMNAAMVDARNKPGLYWKVEATMADQKGGNHVWRSEGEDLNAAIGRTIGLIPQGLLYPDLYKASRGRPKRRVVRRSEQPEKSQTRSGGSSQPKSQKRRVVVRKKG